MSRKRFLYLCREYDDMCFMAIFDKSYYNQSLAERYYKSLLRVHPRRERAERLKELLALDKIIYGGTI